LVGARVAKRSGSGKSAAVARTTSVVLGTIEFGQACARAPPLH
jgi:hypothetical protein